MRSPRSVIALVPLLVLPFAFLQPRSDEPAVKSVHLFDMPAGVTEAELVEAIRQVNSVVTELGYRHAGYKLWRAQTEDPAYGYYWEGLWPSAEAYQSIHDHPRYQEAIDAFTDLYPLIEPVQTYVRYVEVSDTGPGGTGAAGFDEAAVEREVREQVAELVEAWGSLDPDRYLDLFSSDSHWLYEGVPIDPEMLDGMVRSYMGSHAEAEYAWEDTSVEVLGPDAALFAGTFSLRQVDKAGKESSDQGAVTFVLERRNGQWKVVHAHESLPAAEATGVEPRDESMDRAALDSIRAEHVRAVNHRDADLLLESMATDVVYLAPEAAPVLGIDALGDMVRRAYEQFIPDVTMSPREVITSAGWAFEWGCLGGTVTPAAGGDPVPNDGKYLFVYRSHPQTGWKLVYDIYNYGPCTPGSD